MSASFPGAAVVTSAVVAACCAALLWTRAHAGDVRYLARNERLCDGTERACMHGSLTYDVNSREIWLHGRLRTAPGPGTFAIRITGKTRQGWVRYAPVEVRLRGRSNEIVSLRMIPDAPDVASWEIDRIDYLDDVPAR